VASGKWHVASFDMSVINLGPTTNALDIYKLIAAVWAVHAQESWKIFEVRRAIMYLWMQIQTEMGASFEFN